MKRLHPLDRKPAILRAATTLARQHGYTKVSREAIATAAECSPALVSTYFGTMLKLQRAVMGEAIRTGDWVIIAQGLVARDPRAMRIPEAMRRAAVESLM